MSGKVIPTLKRHPFTCLVLLNLALRSIHLFEIKDRIFFSSLILDSRIFDEWAQTIAAGDIAGSGPFLFPPFYPYFLAAVHKLFGPGLVAPRVIQHVAGTLTACLVFAITRRSFGSRAAWWASVLYLLYPVVIFYEGQILGTSLATFFFTASLWLLIRQRSLAAGLLLGLACLARPNLLLAGFFLSAWMVFARRRRIVLGFVLGLCLVLFPVTLRNYLVTHHLVLITSHGGINFFLGNNESSSGAYNVPPGLFNSPLAINALESRKLAEEALGRPLDPVEVSRYWYERGLEFIVRHPWDSLRLEARKLMFFFNNYEPPVNINFEFYRQFSIVLKTLFIPFSVISSLAVAGFAATLGRWRRHTVLYVALGSYILSLLLFSVSTRYRLPAVPLLLVFSGAGLACLTGGPMRTRLGVLAGTVACLFLFNTDLGIRKDFSAAYNNFGNMFSRAGQHEKAAAVYRRGLRQEPDDPYLLFNLGVSLEVRGKYREALSVYEKVRSVNRNFPFVSRRIEETRQKLKESQAASGRNGP